MGLVQIRGLQSKLSYASLLKTENTQAAHTEKMVLLAILWSFGAVLEQEDRMKLQAFMAKQGSTWGLQCAKEDLAKLFDLIVDKQGTIL